MSIGSKTPILLVCIGLTMVPTWLGCSGAPGEVLSREDWEYAQEQLFLAKESQRREFLESEKGRKLLSLRLENLFSLNGLAALREMKKCETYILKGTFEERDTGDCGVVRRGPDLSTEDASCLRDALLDGRIYFMSMDCIPTPQIAFKFRSKKGVVSICLDYKCNYIDVIIYSKYGWVTHRESTYYLDPLGKPDVLARIAKKYLRSSRSGK
jgi:hypothetical protein